MNDAFLEFSLAMLLSYISNFDPSQCEFFTLLSICSTQGPFVRSWFSFVRSNLKRFHSSSLRSISCPLRVHRPLFHRAGRTNSPAEPAENSQHHADMHLCRGKN